MTNVGELYVGTDGIFRVIIDKNEEMQRILVMDTHLMSRDIFISRPIHDGSIVHWDRPVSGSPIK